MKKIVKNYAFIIISILIIEVIFLYSFTFVKDKVEDSYKKNVLSSNKIQYEQLYSNYILITESLFEDMLVEYNIVDLLSGINSKTKAEQDIVRKELYSRLIVFYERHKKLFDLRQLHFHLSDNTSFLRFHKPDKYGDNLTGIRDTVNYVNSVNKKIDGFEEGRVFNGFRFIFPLNAVDGNHIGSVEVSFLLNLL